MPLKPWEVCPHGLQRIFKALNKGSCILSSSSWGRALSEYASLVVSINPGTQKWGSHVWGQNEFGFFFVGLLYRYRLSVVRDAD